ncbi:MAG: hypothetical protein ACR2I5_09835 [Candidatus Limnocylindria bacterium]
MVSGSATDLASTLDALASYALAFDAISEEAGTRYLASDFVEWVRLETVSNGAPRRGRPRANGAALAMLDELSA